LRRGWPWIAGRPGLNPTGKPRVFLLGATGTIGRATARELVLRGFDVVCFVRLTARVDGLAGLSLRFGDVTNAASLARDGFRGERFDVVISCLASRNGTPDDAWLIDHAAQVLALEAAKHAGVSHFILLSAICVQKPRLAFQRAKLAFEAALVASGLRYSIVRPTAYFKSLAGQVARVRQGKPFVVFGDGRLTACKPISDADLARYLVECIDDATRNNRILPIGGPGPAITPRAQGEMLFELLGWPPLFRNVPVAIMDVIIRALSIAGLVFPAAKVKTELARIGRYYATESMLVWDDKQQRYDAEATPETGRETLREYYRQIIAGETVAERGEHAVF
jgi:divinyl chlorophyllide a 8-vinyl-reductase